MARGKKPKNRKEVALQDVGKEVALQDVVVIYPSLHEDVVAALSGEPIYPTPWFNAPGAEEANKKYDTNVMGGFSCCNEKCSKKGWGSKRVGIHIQGFSNNGYNALVFRQRCKACNQLGILEVDEASYIERVAYRLKKWAGVATTRPAYDPKGGLPHLRHLCEGCKRGYCTAGSQDY
ncbi:hypothetical protein GGTG_00217 [Gaeumannomyces tritici R3-111a-1]|uniref:3CxxC-type domain-containing protein n=1 Tax=Gaeumannomyces tritici (strain R3-111a-1) TaxID=644352 RepID=J3NG24_GAET3|nr:hypothetical protein GGTG_00217 [Gaeumannomyces tritici R3-111a-1]EJT80214.1 hypothetical protein GGTG_00217 [Gaeumannomyces tritici R3-111a-1]